MCTGVPLAQLTTLRVGGPARRLVEAATSEQAVEQVRAADETGEALLVLGGGSNLLVGDDGFDGTVIRVATRGIDVVSRGEGSDGVVTELRVAAGEVWDDVVQRAVNEGWAGVEALSGIPGCTGATPVQNVGAYGQDVSATVARVRVWDREQRRVRTLANADCGFGYRTSVFKRGSYRAGPRHVVLDVTFQLREGDLSAPVGYDELARALGTQVGQRVPLAEVRSAVLALRTRKGMVLDADDPDTYSAGSFFTNPVLDAEVAAALPASAPQWPQEDGRVKVSAAWLVEHAGFGRGYGLPGPASLSTKHTLALTNRGGASAADLLALARQVRDGVRRRFGVELVNEPVLVGEQL